MKVFVAIGLFVLFAAGLSLGMVLAVKGNPWLLVGGGALFSVLFWRVGCTSH